MSTKNPLSSLNNAGGEWGVKKQESKQNPSYLNATIAENSAI